MISTPVPTCLGNVDARAVACTYPSPPPPRKGLGDRCPLSLATLGKDMKQTHGGG